MKVIMLSKIFPAYHPRAGEPTGFAETFASGEKIHTIRANAHGHFKDGEPLSVRQWTAKPYASKQVEIGQIAAGIQEVGMASTIAVDGWFKNWEEIAKNDGLSRNDFVDWFSPGNKGPRRFVGDIIHFTDFRYGKGAA